MVQVIQLTPYELGQSENENYTIDMGDALDIGLYTIVYRAKNIYDPNNTDPLYTDCEIKLYVIGNTYMNTKEYCYDEDFVVNLEFNETYREIPNTNNDISIEYVADKITSINGEATTPDLQDTGANCYIYGAYMLNATEYVEPSSRQAHLALKQIN